MAKTYILQWITMYQFALHIDKQHNDIHESPSLSCRLYENLQGLSQASSLSDFWHTPISMGAWQIHPASLLVVMLLVMLIMTSILSMNIISIKRSLQGTVVFYKSHFDLWISFFPLIVYIALKILTQNSTSINNYPPLWIYDSLILLPMAYNYAKVLIENRENPFLAFCVGTSRNTIGYLMPLIAILIYMTTIPLQRHEQTFYAWQLDKITSALVLGIYLWLLHFLVSPKNEKADELKEESPVENSEFTTPKNEAKQKDQVQPNPMPLSPHDVLGLPTDASPEQIKQRYRELSRLYHPDKTARQAKEQQHKALEKMKQINEAYEALKTK